MNDLRTSYYLPTQDQAIGPDASDLRGLWGDFAAEHPEIVTHACNGVTRWVRDGVAVLRYTYCTTGGPKPAFSHYEP